MRALAIAILMMACTREQPRRVPDRAAAKPAALAIFDLDQPDWPARFDAHRFQAALGRLAAKPAAARDAFLAFRDAELAAR